MWSDTVLKMVVAKFYAGGDDGFDQGWEIGNSG